MITPNQMPFKLEWGYLNVLDLYTTVFEDQFLSKAEEEKFIMEMMGKSP